LHLHPDEEYSSTSFLMGVRTDENGTAPINGFSKSKTRLVRAMKELAGKPVPHWVVHDLRRTAKSLIAKARCYVI
jgi:ribosomal protein L39E